LIDSDTVVSSEEIQLCCGLQKSQIADLEKADVIKKKGHGKYLLVESLLNLSDYRSKGGNQKDDSGNVIDYEEQRARKIKEEADALERKRLADELKTFDREEYEKLIADAIQVQKRELSALPLTLQRMVPGMSAKTIEQVTKACARSHNAVLDLQLDAPAADQSV